MSISTMEMRQYTSWKIKKFPFWELFHNSITGNNYGNVLIPITIPKNGNLEFFPVRRGGASGSCGGASAGRTFQQVLR